MSVAEYREVLLRPRIQRRHRLSATGVDVLLTEIVANGIWLDLPSPAESKGDEHLRRILSAEPSALLVTGDLKLANLLRKNSSVLSPRAFADLLGDWRG